MKKDTYIVHIDDVGLSAGVPVWEVMPQILDSTHDIDRDGYLADFQEVVPSLKSAVYDYDDGTPRANGIDFSFSVDSRFALDAFAVIGPLFGLAASFGWNISFAHVGFPEKPILENVFGWSGTFRNSKDPSSFHIQRIRPSKTLPKTSIAGSDLMDLLKDPVGFGKLLDDFFSPSEQADANLRPYFLVAFNSTASILSTFDQSK